MQKVKSYYQLTKPGVTYGNAISAVAGFLFASASTQFHIWTFIWLTVGMTLVIASACVLNNFLDQDIDKLMERTKKRPLIRGEVSGKGAVIFSIALGVVGIGLLYFYTNILATAVAAIGFIVYVVLYGMLSKRLSVHGTLVGSVSGAMPILAGYVAGSGMLDAGAFLVFAVLFLWQMPEFYSISIYRRKEYKAAGVPVISVVHGVKRTKIEIFIYTIGFVIATVLLAILGYGGIVYGAIMTILGFYWIWLGWQGFKARNDDAWARKMFRFSLVALLVFCFMISVEWLLP